ncbi:MAG: class I SAM-dependent methyltransferase [Chlorobiaceae bacterium]|nr:class I SAM-dependent methyltransferase [Chlorobiaceae bacterium]
MELVPCPIAGGRDFTSWIEAPDRLNPHGPLWSIVRSNSSGLFMLNPRPEEPEAASHYPAESYDPFIHEGNPRSARDRAYLATSSVLLRLKAATIMEGLRKPAKAVRILEVGCSSGRLLLHLHRHREIPLENLYGLEPDTGAHAAAQAAGLTHMYDAGTDAIPAGTRFDRIVFWHSLEHIHRITETLEAARRLLEPDGMLVIALPNIDSHDAAVYGPDWVALDAPRHLYHFTPGTLRDLLAHHGFSVVQVKPYLPDTWYNAWYSEKLRCGRAGRRFGLGNALRAAATAGKSALAGFNTDRSSGFVCHAGAAAVSCRPLAGECGPATFQAPPKP